MSDFKCPYCKRGKLALADTNDSLKIYTCNNCNNLTQVERRGGDWQMVVNGVALVSGTATILDYLEVEPGDLVDFFDVF